MFACLRVPRAIAVAPGVSLVLLFVILLSSQSVFSQQTYVSKYDAYVGYAYFNSPKIGLAEKGVHIQVGMNPRTWTSVGFDYSRATGDLVLKPDMLLDSLRTALGAQLAALAAAGRLPAGYTLQVPTASVTQTFAAGPQLSIRHWKPITIFLRPSLGVILETATPHPADPIATGIVAQLSPSGKKDDWVPFYGVGGGFDINLSQHFSVRIQADFVRDHLFDDLLKEARNTIRFSIGPSFHFGKNITE